MFQFTTTHVINSDKDLTTNKDLWTALSGSLHVKGVNNFKKDNVQSIYKAPYTAPVLSTAVFNFTPLNSVTGLAKGDTLRLSLYIRLTEADQCSYYANDTRYKGRPFTIEFPWLGTIAATLLNLNKLIKRYNLLVFEKEVVTTALDSTTSPTKLTLTATNEFQRFHVAKLERFVDSSEPYGEKYVEVDNVVTITDGKEGFGTYSWILRNIKIPTNAHTQAFAPKQNEMPIPGAQYTQYTIHYCVNRGPLGLNAVGDTVKSVTTSVFYVKSDLTTSFETALKTAFGLADSDLTVASGKAYKEIKITSDLEALASRVETLENKN